MFGEFTVFRVTGAYKAVNWFILRSLATDSGITACGVADDDDGDGTVDERREDVAKWRVGGAARMEVIGETAEAKDTRDETGAREGEGDEGAAMSRSSSSLSSSISLSNLSRSITPSRPFSPCLW